MATFAEIKAAFPDIADERAQAMAARGEQLKDPEYHQHIASIAQARKRPVWKPSGQLNIGTGGSQTVKPSRCCKPCKVGTELQKLLAEHGVKGCGLSCSGWESKMNQWGPQGCRDHREEIVARLKAKRVEAGLLTNVKAAAMSLVTGTAWQIDLSDPCGWLVNEAIRRAEAKQAESACTP